MQREIPQSLYINHFMQYPCIACEKWKEREKQRERERERETETETERQTDRQTERVRYRQTETDRQTDRESERDKQRKREREETNSCHEVYVEEMKKISLSSASHLVLVQVAEC